MPTLDSDLASALKQARTKRMFFALVAKGLDGKLLVDKKKISAKDIAEAKKECGGGTIFRGRCQGEDNGATLVFEVAKEPPGTLAAATKKIIKQQAGLTFKAVEFRLAADAEGEEEVEQVEATPASDTAPPLAAPPDPAVQRFADRLKLLAPALQQALATGSPAAEQAKAKMGEANTAFRGKDAVQANTILDQAERLIKQALQARQAATPNADAQAWQTRFAATEPRYLAALQNKSADAGKLRALMAFATGKAEAGEFGKALAALKQIEPLLEQAARAAPPEAVQPHGAFFKEWQAAKSNLQISIDKVGKQLAQFALAILDTNEENLVWVAEEGLSQLMSSLRESAVAIERATSRTPAKVVAKARPALDALRQQLQSAEVKACDDNQLGISVTIRSTINQAIKRLEEALTLAA